VSILKIAAAEFTSAYPGQPMKLRHTLCADDLFSLPSLADLASRLPPSSVEYNTGDLPIGHDAALTPKTGLGVDETIRRINACNSWVALKNVETDRSFREILDACLGALAPLVAPATGPMHKGEAFIFISSPGAVTPLHIDPEHNILFQISGRKIMHIFPQAAGLVSAVDHENYHAGSAHRNIPYAPDLDRFANAFELGAGDGLYVPVKAAHWVKNLGAPSISISITWRTRQSDAEARLRLANHAIRRLGGRPPEPGVAPGRDAAMVFGQRAFARARNLFGMTSP
jgi:hypothetical protein